MFLRVSTRISLAVVWLALSGAALAMAGPSAPTLDPADAPAMRATAVSGTSPVFAQPLDMKVRPGTTVYQTLHASDEDGDMLTFSFAFGPSYMTVTTTDAGPGVALGYVRLAPGVGETAGVTEGSVVVSDRILTDQKSFGIILSNSPPSLDQPSDMQVTEGKTADQVLHGFDLDGDSLQFSLAAGPAFATVTAIGPMMGNVHVAPAAGDAANSPYVTIARASDGVLSDEKTFTIFVLAPSPVHDDNRPPTFLLPVHAMAVSEGATENQDVIATDADRQALTFSKGSGPTFMTVTTMSPVGTGNIHLEPGYSATAGSVTPAAVAVSDGIATTTSNTFSITLSATNQSPTMTPPSDMTVSEGELASQILTGSDPDDAFPFFTKVDGPAFMEVVAITCGWIQCPGKALLELHPGFLDAGSYTGIVRLADHDGRYEDASFEITVNSANAPPAMELPADMVIFVGESAEQTIHATDVDGSPLIFSAGNGPPFMSVQTIDAGAGSATGMIRLAPSIGDVGSTIASVRVSDGNLSLERAFSIEVHPLGTPVLMSIADRCLHPGSTDAVSITAIDAEGDALSFHQTGLPAYGTFSDHGNGTATLAFAPSGTEPFATAFMVVSVSDGTTSDLQWLAINVAPYGQCPGEVLQGDTGDCPGCGAGGAIVNHAPTVNAGGPYAGVVDISVRLDGGQSADPDGQALTFVWDFGDGRVGVGSAVSHAYSSSGQFTIRLAASDGGLVGRATTVATITDGYPTRAFTPNGQTKIRLDTAKPALCVQIEPVGRSYANADLDPSSIVMKSLGTGSMNQIAAVPMKSEFAGDRDENGVEDLTVCFRMDDLRLLFSNVRGRVPVTVAIEGRARTGGRISGLLDLVVIQGAGPSSASIAPNPLNPEGTLTFVTSRPGIVRVSVYDVGGRLVHILREGLEPAGHHELKLGGRATSGQGLASGVYFYRVETPDGVTSGRFAVMK